jgi:hypothetical protein
MAGAVATEEPERINLSIRIPLPEVNRRRVLKIARKMLLNIAVAVLTFIILCKVLWYITHLPA